MKNYYSKILLHFFELAFVLAGIALLCYLTLGQIMEITGDSMTPLLVDKERILAEKVSAKFSNYKRGEIVVFASPAENNRLVIKRVIGLPGDEIAITEGKVVINRRIMEEPYLAQDEVTQPTEKLPESQTVTVPYDNYFMLGDNRDESIDSRYFGFVDKKLIVGRALLVYKPISQFKIIL